MSISGHDVHVSEKRQTRRKVGTQSHGALGPAELPNDRSKTMTSLQTPPTSAGANVPGSLLTPSEVATMFRVDPKTVTRWAKAGKISAIRTLGGHRRFYETEVRQLLSGVPAQRDPSA
jgi:excisionase family DNA binding protein